MGEAILIILSCVFQIKQTPVANRLKVQRDMLSALQFPPVFQLPLDPRLQVCGLKSKFCWKNKVLNVLIFFFFPKLKNASTWTQRRSQCGLCLTMLRRWATR